MRRTKARLLDEYLVASARAGDREAFNALAARWCGKLIAHAYRLSGDVDAARDIAQDGWVEIVRGLPRLENPAHFQAWAYRIVSRRAADMIRSAQRRRRLAGALANDPVVRSNDDQGPDHEDTAPRLAQAIAALPPDQRIALFLFYRDEMSIAEIAVATDAPIGTVKTRLMAAREKLRSQLKGGMSDDGY